MDTSLRSVAVLLPSDVHSVQRAATHRGGICKANYRFDVASPLPKMDAPLELRPIFHIYTWFVSHTSKLPVTTFFKGFHRVNQLSQSSKQFLVHRYDPGTSEYRAPVEAKRREDPPRRRPHAAEQSWPLFLEGIL